MHEPIHTTPSPETTWVRRKPVIEEYYKKILGSERFASAEQLPDQWSLPFEATGNLGSSWVNTQKTLHENSQVIMWNPTLGYQYSPVFRGTRPNRKGDSDTGNLAIFYGSLKNLHSHFKPVVEYHSHPPGSNFYSDADIRVALFGFNEPINLLLLQDRILALVRTDKTQQLFFRRSQEQSSSIRRVRGEKNESEEAIYQDAKSIGFGIYFCDIPEGTRTSAVFLQDLPFRVFTHWDRK